MNNLECRAHTSVHWIHRVSLDRFLRRQPLLNGSAGEHEGDAAAMDDPALRIGAAVVMAAVLLIASGASASHPYRAP